MKIVKKIKKIEDYQLKELEDKTLYINKYDLSLKYNYELASTWKEFFFDILDELLERNGTIDDVPNDNNLFTYCHKNWKRIIKENDLRIDIRDYIELTDYISLEEWEQQINCFIVAIEKDFYLIEIGA